METTDIIELVRAVGRQLQKEEAYINFQLAKQAADEDQELQKLIGEFNDIRNEISAATEQEEGQRDVEKIKKRNEDMRKVYAKIMTNPRMMNYNDTKDEFDLLMNRIKAIIDMSSEGEDPDTADYCTGSCATCGGCG